MATDDLLAAAIVHEKAGRLDQAAALYETVLAEIPNHADASHHAGVIALRRGDTESAVARLRLAAEAAPDRAIIHNDLGAALRIADRLEEAAAALERATELDPRFADAWSNLGFVRRAMGDHGAARIALERAIALKPGFAPAHNALGVVLQSLGEPAAVAAFERAIELKPDYAEALTNLGLLHHAQGRPDAALPSLRRAASLAPARGEAWLNFGLAQRAAGNAREARVSLERAVSLTPGLAAAWNALGIVLAALGEPQAACDCLARAAGLDPRSAEILSNHGLALHKAGRDDEALVALERALEVEPRHAGALFNRGVIRHRSGDFAGARADWQATIEADPSHREARSNFIFALHYESGIDGERLLATAREYDRIHGRPPGRYTAWPNPRAPERPLRIGYVSPDFRQHSVAHYLEPLLAAHDPDAVEIFAYAELDRPDAVTARLQALVPNWRTTTLRSDAAVARSIRDDGIDILVDLAGHSAGNRLGVFALRPAPIQVAWLGFPGTTGLSAIDWRLTDAIADPPGAEKHASEALVRLPRGFHCWRPPADAPEVRARPDARRPMFGSFNNAQKLSAETIAVWSRILALVPDAGLSLKSAWLSRPFAAEALRRAFARHGIAPERLVLSGWIADAGGHLGAYGDVDVALDPFPYNGTTTTLEALWMGVPVITLRGDRHSGRVGASLLAQIGAGELIAATADAYVELAVALAADRARRDAYRSTLRARVAASPVADAPGFARALEAAYRTMWRDWCAGAGQAGTQG